ncbi:MAG: hypothetical protein GC162_20410 [Planctomycetes bacterium]|nr:hypothetical protein [Planctomycetota bacterium]
MSDNILPDGGEWGTHLKYLLACAARTSGPILELGGGVHSSSALSRFAREQCRKVVCYEPVPSWIQKIRKLEHEHYQVKPCPLSYHGYPDWNQLRYEAEQWGAVLVDQTPVSGRLVSIAAFLDEQHGAQADFIVVHDTEIIPVTRYYYEPLLRQFQHRWDSPDTTRTTVVSNHEDCRFLAGS